MIPRRHRVTFRAMSESLSFRDLLQKVQQRACVLGKPPTPLRVLAGRCGLSRQHLYHLIWGTQEASPWVLTCLSQGLRVPVGTVKRAIAKSRKVNA